jgi:hypothetical protein
VAAAAVAWGLLVVLAACSGASGAGAPTATGGGDATASLPGASTPGDQASATPGLTPIGPGGGVQGSGDVCTQPVTVSAQLPSSIPTYPHGQLRIGQVNGGIGFYGVCTMDTVAVIAHFYTIQLPAKGWNQLNSSMIDTVELITASQGSATISIAIRPESTGNGQTDIVIQTNGL